MSKSKPSSGSDWRDSFLRSSMKSTFAIVLSQPMLELLCAVADGVYWDRSLYRREYGCAKPDNWLGSEAALTKRGLVERVPRALQTVDFRTHPGEQDHLRLTPAGVALVELLKVAGIFIEADNAIAKRARRK